MNSLIPSLTLLSSCSHFFYSTLNNQHNNQQTWLVHKNLLVMHTLYICHALPACLPDPPITSVACLNLNFDTFESFSSIKQVVYFVICFAILKFLNARFLLTLDWWWEDVFTTGTWMDLRICMGTTQKITCIIVCLQENSSLGSFMILCYFSFESL